MTKGVIKRSVFDLRYYVEGSGTPLFIVGDAHYYLKVFSLQLREHFQMVFMDHRGFADSPGTVDLSEFELEHILDDMDALRARLGIEKMFVLGHSGHAYMALEYAKKYAHHCHGAIMVGIAPNLSAQSSALAESSWQALADEQRKAALVTWKQKFPQAELEKLNRSDRFIAEYLSNTPKIWYDYEFDAAPLFKDSTFNLDMIEYVWGDIFANIDITKGADNLTVPVWVALGRYDGLVAPTNVWEPVQKAFKNMQITIYEKSGHTPQYEQAELFDADLIAWCRDVGPCS